VQLALEIAGQYLQAWGGALPNLHTLLDYPVEEAQSRLTLTCPELGLPAPPNSAWLILQLLSTGASVVK
jgi:hypothetical protein